MYRVDSTWMVQPLCGAGLGGRGFRLQLLDGERCGHYGFAGYGCDLKLASELAEALAHAAHSDAGLTSAGYFRLLLRRNAFAGVLHLNTQLICSLCDANGSAAAAGMPVHIRQAFLNNAKYRRLQFGRQAAQVGRQIEADLDFTALRKAFHIVLQCRNEADFIEQRRMEQMGNGANLARKLCYQVRAFNDVTGGLRRQAVAFALDGGQIHPQSGYNLPNAVVQFARYAATLLILHLQKAAGKLAHNVRLCAELGVCLLELAGALADPLLEFGMRAAELYARFSKFVGGSRELGRGAADRLGKNDDGQGDEEVDDRSGGVGAACNSQAVDRWNEPILLAQESEKHGQEGWAKSAKPGGDDDRGENGEIWDVTSNQRVENAAQNQNQRGNNQRQGIALQFALEPWLGAAAHSRQHCTQEDRIRRGTTRYGKAVKHGGQRSVVCLLFVCDAGTIGL